MACFVGIVVACFVAALLVLGAVMSNWGRN